LEFFLFLLIKSITPCDQYDYAICDKLGKTQEEFIKICISMHFYAIDEDIYTATVNVEPQCKVPTACFNLVYSKILQSISLDETVAPEVAPPKGAKSKPSINTN
jgi:hypothetical protein